MKVFLLSGVLCLIPSFAFCQSAPVLTVQGVGGKSISLSAADIALLPQQTIQSTDHGTQVTLEGVPLMDLLGKVDLPAGEKFHKTAVSYYLLVEAKDGYRAVFSWAELDPTIVGKLAYVITKRDGKPLPEKDGPFQLAAPGEKRGARWVRQVTALRIRQAN